MEIKVLGSGCANCKKLLGFAQEAVREMAIDTEVIYVTDMMDIVAAGLMRTPGLIINGNIKASGRIPPVKEIKEMIAAEK
jgi:small redox-active disulfide protein 2